MKAIITTILIFLCVAAVHAGPEIGDVPMIGFARVPIQQGMNLIGTQFLEIGTTNVNITELIGISELTPGTDPSCADSVWVWKNNAYQQYHLSSLDPDTWTTKTCWVNSTTFEEVEDILLTLGDAFWLSRKGDADEIAVAGEVVSDAQISLTFMEGKNLFSYPYSTSENINNIDNSSMTAGTSINDADSIWVWNNAGYDKYYLSNVDPVTLLSKRCWVNTETLQETNFELTVGKGYWFIAQNQTIVTFTKPY